MIESEPRLIMNETFSIIVTGLTEKSAYILDVETMNHAEIPMLSIWVNELRRAFVTQEILTIKYKR